MLATYGVIGFVCLLVGAIGEAREISIRRSSWRSGVYGALIAFGLLALFISLLHCLATWVAGA